MKTTHGGVSLAIVTILALHAAPVIQELLGHRQTFWPIMAWGMYRFSRPADHTVQDSRWRSFGITASGERIDLEPGLRDIGGDYTPGRPLALFRSADDPNLLGGLRWFAMYRFYWEPMRRGDPDAQQAAEALAARLNRGREDPFVGFHLEYTTFTLTDDGLEASSPPPIVYRVSPP